jgi:integrase
MAKATRGDVVTLRDAVDRARELLDMRGRSEQTAHRLEALMREFALFVERGHGISSLDEVSPALAMAYLGAPTSAGRPPGASLQYFRRLAVRTLFRLCRESGYDVGDPTTDAALPSRRPAPFRPLTDDEVELARSVVVATRHAERAAAAWALAEATAQTAELAAVRRRDVDVVERRVWVHGSRRLTPRWGELTDWGVTQLSKRLSLIADDADVPVIGGGEPGTALAQSTAVGLLGTTLTRAGLRNADGVRPASVAAWAGRRFFDSTGRIDLTASRVGMSSLDRTARFIGWDWVEAGE